MNSTASGTITCKCQHCNQSLRFDIEHAGETIPCPNCKMDTVLSIPRIEPQPQPPPQSALPGRKHWLAQCADCAEPISHKAMFCPHCGAIPSLWRSGWFAFCILGIAAVFYFLIILVLTGLFTAAKL